MQTMYYQTSNYIRHEGNVVDLGAYRRRLDAVSGGHWLPEVRQAEARWESAPSAALRIVERPCATGTKRDRRSGRRAELRFWLDVCASGAVLLFTMTAVMQFLRFF